MLIHNVLLAVMALSAGVFSFVFLRDVWKKRSAYRATPALPLLGASFVISFFVTFGMGSCTLLQSWAGIRFIKASAYHAKAAFAFAAAGIVAVPLAAYIVKSLPLTALKWVVVVVILYTSTMMFRSIGKNKVPEPGR